MSQVTQWSSGKVRKGFHLGATAGLWVWTPLCGLASLAGLVTTLSADPRATELDALPRVFGMLVLASAPVGLVVAVTALRALRWESSRALQRWARRVALAAGVVALLVLVALWTSSARRGSWGALDGVLWVLALWPVVVLPVAVMTVVALRTRPDPFAAPSLAGQPSDLLR